MTLIFTLTLFLSSGLLFLIQPLCAKMLLPLLGGSPGVWNTCMVFFQAGLLAGYAYAHVAPAWLGLKRQAFVHGVLLAGSLFLLPFVVPQDANPPAWPVFWLLGLLSLGLGVPFVLLASTGPLLQKWFGALSGKDPYFLYSASNLGSLIGLLAYPLLVERIWTLPEQSILWTWGYGLWGLLTIGCAFWVVQRQNTDLPISRQGNGSAHVPPLPPGWATRLRWLLLALAPSSLMLSVTVYLTADIAAIPLLWVGPLGLYLVSFIFVFARRPPLPHALVVRWLPAVALIVVFLLLSEGTEPIGVVMALHLIGLFWVALACHGELARTRPAPLHLTEFYFWLALGGVLGGLFNTLAAPLLFSSAVEYPLMLVLACLLRPGANDVEKKTADNPPMFASGERVGRIANPSYVSRADLFLGLVPGVLTALLAGLAKLLGLEAGPVSVAIIFAAPALVCFLLLERPVRFAVGLGGLLLASVLYPGVRGQTTYSLRSFFGVHRVTEKDGCRILVHGNTVHGQQSLDPSKTATPLAYYHPTGPAGQVFGILLNDERLQRVALIGLGAGALASYARPGQHWTFFEIDPAVVYLARDAEQFTYLKQARGHIDIVVGDGRLKLAQTKDAFGLIVVDAFGSDSIPLHLLTRQAMDLYLSRLGDQGLLLLHVSNRYVDLLPVLGNLARDRNPPLVGLVRSDQLLTADEKAAGKSPSVWVVLAKHAEHLGPLAEDRRWQPLPAQPRLGVWTDDFSNIGSVIDWRVFWGPRVE